MWCYQEAKNQIILKWKLVIPSKHLLHALTPAWITPARVVILKSAWGGVRREEAWSDARHAYINGVNHAISRIYSRHRVITNLLTPWLTPPYHRWRELTRYSVSTENSIGNSWSGVKCPDINSIGHLTPAMVWCREVAWSRHFTPHAVGD